MIIFDKYLMCVVAREEVLTLIMNIMKNRN